MSVVEPDPFGPPNQDLGNGDIYDPVDVEAYPENETEAGTQSVVDLDVSQTAETPAP